MDGFHGLECAEPDLIEKIADYLEQKFNINKNVD